MKNFHFHIRPFERDPQNNVLRAIPVDTRGKLFVSAMPFGAYDRGNRLIRFYRQSHIRHVFVLAQAEEIRVKARRDLFGEYLRIGATVSHYPFVDMHAPDLDGIIELVQTARRHLARHNIAIHCHAGVGRTSVAACCVIQSLLDMTPEESIAYVRKHMEVNMTSEQVRVVEKFRGALLRG